MTVHLTYDSVIGRVQITADGLLAAATAIVERSTDGIRWTTVRGAGAVPVTSGAIAIPVNDFEFPVGATVTYRVRGVDPSPASFVAVGVGDTGADGSRTPAMPAGIVTGDLLLLLASTRNSGTGIPDVPAGWTHLGGAGCMRLMGRIWDGVFAAPTVTFTGGATNEDTLAQIAGFRNVTLSPSVAAVQLNPSPVQNIAFSGQGTLAALGMLVIYIGWKADAWTSVANLVSGFTHEISELTSVAGTGAGQVWDYYLPATTAPINSGSFVVTGGTTAISRGGTISLPHADNAIAQTATITPALDGVWLKSISRPFLNRVVDTRLASTIDVSRKSRATLFPIIERSVPIAVSSVRGSREWTMLVQVDSTQDRDDTELLLASGDVILVQAPPDSGVEAGYASVGDITRQAHPLRPLSWLFTLPLTEVAEPSADVVGSVGSWLTVTSHFSSWEAVVAAHATWASLLSIVGDPTEVIVP